jgi:hypothetical protein
MTRPIGEWIHDHLPADRDLDQLELAQFATIIGELPELWQDKVRHDSGKRYYEQLYRDSHIDVWLICWLDDQKTGYHDHDLSSGGVYVCEGTLIEDRFVFSVAGLEHSSRERRAGESFVFDGAYIHGMRHAGGPPVVSIHCYSPPLWRMGYYEADAQGSLSRTSMTYLDEIAESA